MLVTLLGEAIEADRMGDAGLLGICGGGGDLDDAVEEEIVPEDLSGIRMKFIWSVSLTRMSVKDTVSFFFRLVLLFLNFPSKSRFIK